MVLQECGLGRRKICFNSKGNYSNLEEKLFKEFPKLADGGGFQIMRTGLGGNSSSLAVIPPPPSGYSVSFLRDASGLGQALAYVRPLQRDLDTKVNPVSDAYLNTTNVQKVECINCGEKVVMLMWEQHTTSCQGGPSSRINESVQVTTNASCTEKCDLPKDIIVVKCDEVQDEDNIKIKAVSQLGNLFPKMHKELIEKVYNASNGDLDQTASILVGLTEDETAIDNDTDEDNDTELSILSSINPLEDVSGDPLEVYLSGFVKEGRQQVITVSRKSTSLLADQIRLHKQGLEIKFKPNVEFIDEDAVDASGPTKEFFHLMMQTLVSGDRRISLFEGKPDHLLPLHSIEAIESNLFYYAGRMIAHSFLHKGFPFVGMTPAAVTYILSASVDEAIPQITLDDVPDIFMKDIIYKMMSATKEELEVLNMTDEVMSILLTSGFVNKLLTCENKEKAIQDVLIYNVLRMRITELDEIRRGLESVGLASFLKHNPSFVCKTFAYRRDITICAEDLLKKIKVYSADLSDDENMSLCWFKQLINELPVEAQTENPYVATLEKLTQFVYGDPLPPSKAMIVKFTKKEKMLPDVDSCTATIQLPIVHRTFDEFKKVFNSTLSVQATGYGRL